MRDWIKCSERLPETADIVTVTVERGCYCTNRTVAQGRCFYSPTSGHRSWEVRIKEEGSFKGYGYGKVLAWMPLPEPYEGEA